MLYRLANPEELNAFLKAKKVVFHRGALLKQYKKWIANLLPSHEAVLCDHSRIQKYSCYCTSGCEACRINYKCSICNTGFATLKEAAVYNLHLEPKCPPV